MTTILVSHGDSTTTLDVPQASFNGVRPCCANGMFLVQVRETDEAERDLVANERYAATWLGWHRGQCPAYGATPEEAARRLAAGEVG